MEPEAEAPVEGVRAVKVGFVAVQDDLLYDCAGGGIQWDKAADLFWDNEYPANEIWFVQDGVRVGRITNIGR